MNRLHVRARLRNQNDLYESVTTLLYVAVVGLAAALLALVVSLA